MDAIDPLLGALVAQLMNLVVMWLRDLDGERCLDVRITWRTGRRDRR
ncbi:hypothetical protein HH310_09315 [Actinoplanes sp. TBRC 11911]|nr:hypothetical protein [Actinoplanes sp. TBRC 11911]NMO51387.1 hypothetical protein [Actinoplanes sp. TBRC 11911]